MSRFVTTAGEQLAELVATAADEGRFSRGRALYRKGSVTDLSVTEGSIIASVRGSEGDDYETTVGTAPAPPGVIRQIAQVLARDSAQHPVQDTVQNPAQYAARRWDVDELLDDGLELLPREIDLAFGCTCADWDEPCKHVVAVLLAFADRVDLDDDELLRWRGIDLSRLPDRDRTANIDRTAKTDRSGHTDRTAKLSELEALLGDTVLRVPTADASDPEPSTAPPDPVLAEFLGVGMTLSPAELMDQVDLAGLTAPAPLFGDVQLGPLADLGPELAKALAIIGARLTDTASE